MVERLATAGWGSDVPANRRPRLWSAAQDVSLATAADAHRFFLLGLSIRVSAISLKGSDYSVSTFGLCLARAVP